MLTDADRLLIAESLDGPLAPPAAERLATLLARSPEARRLTDALAADRLALHKLPRLIAPAGMADRVWETLPVVAVPVRSRSSWLPYATAAGVFIAVGLLAYTQSGTPARPGPAVAMKPPPAKPPVVVAAVPPEVAPSPREVEPPKPVLAIAPPEAAPAPRAVPPTLLAAGLFTEIDPPAEVVARLPLVGTLGELSGPAGRDHTAGLWATAPAVRLDLFSADPVAAVAAVQTAAKGCGIGVSVEAAAAALLKTKQPTAFVFCVEGLTAADAGRLFTALSEQSGFRAVHLSAAGANDQRELRDLLGEPKRTPRDDSTIGQVVSQLPGKPAGLLYATAAKPGPGSREVKAFAEARSERKPGTLPLLVMVRGGEAN